MTVKGFLASILVACFAVATPPVSDAGPVDWIPARWPGGPLEVQRRAREGTLPAAPALRETIASWYQAATLDLLSDTPINCLLLTWSAGADPAVEREQQALVKAYARAARSRGIAVLGVVDGPATLSSSLGPAIDAELDGLVLEGSAGGDRISPEAHQALQKRGRTFVIVSAVAREGISQFSEVLAAAGALMPRVQELPAEAEANPSSEPWIDSNIWLVRSIRSWDSSRPTWLMETLASDAAAADYLRATADAAAGGGRWALALGDELRHGLRANVPAAVKTWRQIGDFLKFQQEHTAWYGYAALAFCGFVQDSAGPEREVSGEHLKLAVRRRIPLKLLERSHLTPRALEGLRAIHAMDLVQPTESEREILTQFARSGGLLVVGPSWGKVETDDGREFGILPTGKGRIVVYREAFPDPGELAKSLVDLIGRDNLPVRLFRAFSVLTEVSAEEGGRKVVVHLVNYASFPAESVLVRLDGDFQRASLYTPGRPPEQLVLDKSGGRVEVTVARLPVYSVLSFER